MRSAPETMHIQPKASSPASPGDENEMEDGLSFWAWLMIFFGFSTPKKAKAASKESDAKSDSKEAPDSKGDTPATTANKGWRQRRKEEFLENSPKWLIAGRPIHFGLRRLLWWFYAHLHFGDHHLYNVTWIPQPRATGSYLVEVFRMAQAMIDRRDVCGGIITVLSAKGGATKTTFATWFAAILAWFAKAQVVVFDTDTGGGQVAKRYGLNWIKALTVKMAIALVKQDWKPTNRVLGMHTVADRDTGVMVVHCEKGTVITADDMSQTLDAFQEAGHTLVVDTRPGLDVPATTTAVGKSVVNVLTGKGSSDDDLDLIEEALDFEPYNFKSPDIRKTVVIEVSGIPWLRYNTRTQYLLAERFDVDPNQVVLIPADRYVRRHASLTKVEKTSLAKIQRNRIRVSLLRPKMLYAFCNAADVVTARAAMINSAKGIPPLPKIEAALPVQSAPSTEASITPPTPAEQPA